MGLNLGKVFGKLTLADGTVIFDGELGEVIISAKDSKALVAEALDALNGEPLLTFSEAQRNAGHTKVLVVAEARDHAHRLALNEGLRPHQFVAVSPKTLHEANRGLRFHHLIIQTGLMLSDEDRFLIAQISGIKP